MLLRVHVCTLLSTDIDHLLTFLTYLREEYGNGPVFLGTVAAERTPEDEYLPDSFGGQVGIGILLDADLPEYAHVEALVAAEREIYTYAVEATLRRQANLADALREAGRPVEPELATARKALNAHLRAQNDASSKVMDAREKLRKAVAQFRHDFEIRMRRAPDLQTLVFPSAHSDEEAYLGIQPKPWAVAEGPPPYEGTR